MIDNSGFSTRQQAETHLTWEELKNNFFNLFSSASSGEETVDEPNADIDEPEVVEAVEVVQDPPKVEPAPYVKPTTEETLAIQTAMDELSKLRPKIGIDLHNFRDKDGNPTGLDGVEGPYTWASIRYTKEYLGIHNEEGLTYTDLTAMINSEIESLKEQGVKPQVAAAVVGNNIIAEEEKPKPEDDGRIVTVENDAGALLVASAGTVALQRDLTPLTEEQVNDNTTRPDNPAQLAQIMESHTILAHNSRRTVDERATANSGTHERNLTRGNAISSEFIEEMQAVISGESGANVTDLVDAYVQKYTATLTTDQQRDDFEHRAEIMQAKANAYDGRNPTSAGYASAESTESDATANVVDETKLVAEAEESGMRTGISTINAFKV